MIRILKPGDEPALEAFLRPRVESSMFLIGNMRAAGLADSGQTYTGTYAAAFEDEQMTGVAAHYWNQMLVLQAPHQPSELCRAAVGASRRPICGLIGPDDQVEAARETLEIEPSEIQMDEAARLYSLSLAELRVPKGLGSGALSARRIAPGDLDLMTEWEVAYSLESLGEQDGPQLWEKCRATVEHSIQEGRTWVLEAQGKPVARSAFNAAIREAVQVGGVWTPPEFRCRGYARSVVAASLLAARAEGVEKAVLFTGEGNLAAQKAYAALGFRHTGAYRLLHLRASVKLSRQPVNLLGRQ